MGQSTYDKYPGIVINWDTTLISHSTGSNNSFYDYTITSYNGLDDIRIVAPIPNESTTSTGFLIFSRSPGSFIKHANLRRSDGSTYEGDTTITVTDNDKYNDIGLTYYVRNFGSSGAVGNITPPASIVPGISWKTIADILYNGVSEVPEEVSIPVQWTPKHEGAPNTTFEDFFTITVK